MREERMPVRQLVAELRIALAATAALGVLLCGLYPIIVWGLAQGLFPAQANGSLVLKYGEIVGSHLLAQPFTGERYFHPRPSAAGAGYDASSSGGTNLGSTSKKLIEEVGRRVERYRTENGLRADALVPADAVTSSASGLDPHIGVRNARIQARRVAAARGISEETVLGLVAACTEGRTLKLFGEPRVNVLTLNERLDEAWK
jgi:K+-transporting ATPase ATPase C chain